MKTSTPNFRASIRKAITAPAHSAVLTRLIEAARPAAAAAARSSKLSIAAASRALGVTRTHLSLVLNGHRQSRRLTSRYQALKQQQLIAA